MISSVSRSIARSVAALALCSASASGYAATVFANPFEAIGGDTSQSTKLVTFKATVAGTLNGFLVGGISAGGNPVGFLNSVGVFLGAPPTTEADRIAAQNSLTYFAPNQTANFGASLFGGVSVTAGQSITFVLKANSASTPYAVTSNTSDPNNKLHYIWSDESSVAGNYGQNGAAPSATVANQASKVTATTDDILTPNAMTYSKEYVVAAGGLTGDTSCATGQGTARDCLPSASRNGTIAAGNYTYVGFNDWQGGPSNSYFDYAFLFNITPTTTTTSKVPEPGTLALALVGLFGTVAARRNRAKRQAA